MMEYYAQLVEQAPDGMVIHDGHRIVEVNAATLRMAGATHREQLVGQLVSSLFERPFLKAVEQVLCRPEGGERVSTFIRERLHGIDGEVRTVEISAQLFFKGGRPTAHLVLHDARERLRAEQEAEERWEQARWAERAADARSIAGGIAHQLNNKLQIILGFGGELVASAMSEDQRADIAEINRAANECARITRQLLQVASDAPFSGRAVLLSSVTNAIVQELEYVAGAPVRYTTEVVPAVHLDLAQFRQMLENLVENARHATEGRGAIDVIVRSTVLTTALLACDGRRMPPGCYVAVTVRDAGRGISEHVQHHMFEPFYSTDRMGQAAGLGLSAVQGMIRQNGGFLTFSSAEGKGSAFTLWFPEVTNALRAEAAQTQIASSLLANTIVVIDDQTVSRTTMVRGLERVGFRVLATRSAEEATEVMSHIGRPALIVMGASIPVRYPRLRRILQAQWPLLRTLVLGADVRTGVPAAAPLADSGTWFTLHGPLSQYALVSRVRELLGAPDLV